MLRNYRAVAAIVSLLTALPIANAVFGAGEIRREEVRIQRGDVFLAATLQVPEGSGLAGAVIVHGSGDSDRSNPWTRAWVDALVARGIAVLYPDKRGSGASSGDWKNVDLQTLAADAVAAVELLQADGRIDPERVGVIGFSQGGHVAPLAALASKDVAFAISISGSVVPWLDQVRDEVELAVERSGVDEALGREVLALHDLAVECGLGEREFADYAAALATLKGGPLGDSPLVERFPPSVDHWVFDWMRQVCDPVPPDPMAAWLSAKTPALFVYGSRDTQLRVADSLERIARELEPSTIPYDVLLLGGNGHSHYRDDAADFVARWIRDGGRR
jgi:pimeloyl-ACP methyl ester carboxylesterase